MPETNWKRHIPSLANVGRLVLTLLAGLFGVLAVKAGWHGDATGMGAAGTLAIVCVLAANLHLLESFSGFGIEARTRALQQKLDEADEIMRKVRRMGELAGQSIVTHQATQGRSGVQTVAGNYALSRHVRGMLVEVGSSADAVRVALEPWATWIIRDIAYGYSQRLHVAQKIAARRLEKGDPKHPKAAEFLHDRLRNTYDLNPDVFPVYWEDAIRDMPFLTEDDRLGLQAEAAELRPVVEAIRHRQEIPDPDKWLPRLEHICHTRVRNDGVDEWSLDGWSKPDPRFRMIP
jgi:hypothetical protein